MGRIVDALGHVRLAHALPDFLREPVSAEGAKAYIRERMQTRPQVFLQMLDRAVFGNPRSPYLQLFQAAACQPGDVRCLVAREGVEGTLRELQRAGIYVTLEEFKGRVPAVCGSRTFEFSEADFDNPTAPTHFGTSSGGSRGRPTRVSVSLTHIAQTVPHWAVWFAAHGWSSQPVVFWTPVHAGVAIGQLRYAKTGQRFVKWFSLCDGATFKDRMAAAYVHGVIRRAAGFPRPEPVALGRAWVVGEFIAALAHQGPTPCVNVSPSVAVRISRAMQQRGVSLANVAFLLRGEPLTSERKAVIEASGARAVQTYGFAEGGTVGSQCPAPAEADDVHVFLDAFAVIGRDRPPHTSDSVKALLMTALRPACPKIMLNTEIGDCGVLETRPCGCLLDTVGYNQHIHGIRSFEKLNGEGVTFFGADLQRLLEKSLPERFGGSVGDYQLLEEQDAHGIAHHTLVVSPDVGPLDEGTLRTAFLGELRRISGSYRLMVNLWEQADSLEVSRRSPVQTGRGKILPFIALGSR
jgi:hypothetical protein